MPPSYRIVLIQAPEVQVEEDQLDQDPATKIASNHKTGCLGWAWYSVTRNQHIASQSSESTGMRQGGKR